MQRGSETLEQRRECLFRREVARDNLARRPRQVDTHVVGLQKGSERVRTQFMMNHHGTSAFGVERVGKNKKTGRRSRESAAAKVRLLEKKNKIWREMVLLKKCCLSGATMAAIVLYKTKLVE